MIALPLGLLDGIVPLIVLLISFVVWLINQLNAKNEQQQKQQKQLQRRNQPRGGATPRPPQPTAGPAPQQQVEDFLRRVMQQPAQAPGPVGGRTSAPPVVAAEVVDESLGGRGVSQHVDVYLDSADFQQRASMLTALDQVDEQVDSHIHQIFDHEIGSLSSGADPGTVAPITDEPARELPPAAGAAAGVALMLSTPESLRNAIVMQEILRRPDFD